MKIYRVTLTEEEQQELIEITTKGKRNAQVLRNAYILLNVDESEDSKKKKDIDVATFLNITVQTVENIRKKFVLEGYDTALYGRPSKRIYERKIDGDAEAHLIALSCGEPPQGFARWSLRLLSNKMVELNYTDSISHETVRTVLKKRIETVEGGRLDYSSETK